MHLDVLEVERLSPTRTPGDVSARLAPHLRTAGQLNAPSFKSSSFWRTLLNVGPPFCPVSFSRR